MASDGGYNKLDTSDMDLPPPPVISESVDQPFPVSFPPPPPSPVIPVTNDVSAVKSKTDPPSGIKGVQLVKVITEANIR